MNRIALFDIRLVPRQMSQTLRPSMSLGGLTVIDASPCGELTFLIKILVGLFTDAGFGNKFRSCCDQAGLRHCGAQAGLTIAAENGATTKQLMAIFG
jgi:hypothetical protein